MDKTCKNCGHDFGTEPCQECFYEPLGWVPKQPTIPVKLMNTDDSEFLPYRKYANDAGADLRARIFDKMLIHPEQVVKIPTGIAVDIPPGYFGLILPRSGASLSGKVAIIGTIDAQYTGELSISVVNVISETVQIVPKERLAQLVVLPYVPVKFEQVDELKETERGDKGYGSTGAI